MSSERNLFACLLSVGLLAAGCGDDSSGGGGNTGGAPPASECDADLQAVVTVHDAYSIEEDEHWAIGTHVVPQTISVRSGATLTIDGCAIVRMAPDTDLEIPFNSDGSIIAKGTAKCACQAPSDQQSPDGRKR
ncbi:MAG TPA: hypothetical protein PKO46_23150, partial [Sedimentisphaerales bacterium]|nr:hypothetical protein [Sedimentisphaerales bacterium]